MPVPEAAVDEDAGAVLPHHYVGLARQARVVEPIAVAIGPQPPSHDYLGFGVLCVYGGHVGVALLG